MTDTRAAAKLAQNARWVMIGGFGLLILLVAALTLLDFYRLQQAREEGARRLTALSDNARMDRWLEQRGFVPGWFTAGYAAGDGGSAAGDARHGGHVPSRGRDG